MCGVENLAKLRQKRTAVLVFSDYALRALSLAQVKFPIHGGFRVVVRQTQITWTRDASQDLILTCMGLNCDVDGSQNRASSLCVPLKAACSVWCGPHVCHCRSPRPKKPWWAFGCLSLSLSLAFFFFFFSLSLSLTFSLSDSPYRMFL